MRYLVILTALTTLLTGCSLPLQLETTSFSEATHPLSRDSRQAIILSHENEGIYDEQSVFAYPVFIGTDENYTSSYLSEIYRTIHPWNGESDIFDTLNQQINKTTDNLPLGDILVPYLLTEEAVNISDEDLFEILYTITEAHVFSKNSHAINYRLIALNGESYKEYKHWMNWHYFVQVWDDDHIWAQPLYEGIEFEFDQAVFVTEQDENQLVLLSGRTERPIGSSFAVAGTGFMFEEGLWTPIKWEEIYEEVAKPENLDIGTDGIRMIYIDPYMAQSFYLPQHKGMLYELKLTEDGSFWADYSKYPDYHANENLPPDELLFKIKMWDNSF